jgi:hypothetical protein
MKRPDVFSLDLTLLYYLEGFLFQSCLGYRLMIFVVFLSLSSKIQG